MTTVRNPGTISNHTMPHIVALRGDELFWISSNLSRCSSKKMEPKQRRGCENTEGGMVVAGLGCCLCDYRQQQAATGKISVDAKDKMIIEVALL